ncbi:transporter [Rhizobium sp. Leaf384]|uniref:TolC family outer membrane protein n=1 Tax=unclassified Rhizobium TaxID=2613769 RepID=UPI0007123FBE|nr:MULTISPECIES: TolC family outer membrane protein [unclassified Rhizobium]KQS78563.1 transporter [Rhizobium sp. Leaf383]KQS79633.1 transporter [Rhizobium sp. Leaf384]
MMMLALTPSGVAKAETIADAMAKAYVNNPDLNAARAGLRAVDEAVAIAKSGYRPQVSAVVTATQTRYDSELQQRPRDFHEGSAGLTITQQIFDGFQTLNEVRASESTVLSGRESLKANEISILLSAAEAYANIVRDLEVVAIRHQNISFLKEQLKAANARRTLGEGTRTDVSQAEAELASSKALLATAVSQLKQSEAVYFQIVGREPRNIKAASPAKSGIPRTLDEAVAAGLRDNPQIIAAEYAVNAAGYRVKQAEGAMLPGVTIQGLVNRNTGDSFRDGGIDTTSGSITLRLQVPIYQGGVEYGQIRQAKEREGQQAMIVDKVRMDVRRTVVSSYAQLEAALAAIAANKQQIHAANKALSGVIEERKVGQRTTLDVLDAQQSVLVARESLAASQRNAVVASYSILASIGALTVRGQNVAVAEYRPEEHYEAVKNKSFGSNTNTD